MRWLVEITPASSSARATAVHADTWQGALEQIRGVDGDEEAGPLSGFAIELVDEGVRAVDSRSRTVYRIRPAREEDASVDTVRRMKASLEVLSQRYEEPTADCPIVYREKSFATPPETSEEEAEALLTHELATVKAAITARSEPKYVVLAAFPDIVDGRPKLPPLAVLRWRDWRGAKTDVEFPRRPRPLGAPPQDNEAAARAAAQSPARAASSPQLVAAEARPAAVDPSASDARSAAPPRPKHSAPPPPPAPQRTITSPPPPPRVSAAAASPIGNPETKLPGPTAITPKAPPAAVITPTAPPTVSRAPVAMPPATRAHQTLLNAPAVVPTQPPPPPAPAASASSQPRTPAATATLVGSASVIPVAPQAAAALSEGAPRGPQTLVGTPSVVPRAAALIPSDALAKTLDVNPAPETGADRTSAKAVAAPSAVVAPSSPSQPVAAPSAVVAPSSPSQPVAVPSAVVAPSSPSQPVAAPSAVAAPSSPSQPVATTKATATSEARQAASQPASQPEGPPSSTRGPASSRTGSSQVASGPVGQSFPPPGLTAGAPSSDDLMGDLFDALQDLLFVENSIEGARLCARALREKIPCRLVLAYFYDIDKAEFLVAAASGEEADAFITRRTRDKDPMLAQAMRKSKTLSFSDLAGHPPPERLAPLGSVRTTIVAPAVDHGRYLGALELIDPAGDEPFLEHQAHALGYVAEQFAETITTRGTMLEPAKIRAAHREA